MLKMESFALQSRMYPYAGGKACTPSEALHSTFLGCCVQSASHFAIKPILGDAVDIHVLFQKAKSFISNMFIFVEF